MERKNFIKQTASLIGAIGIIPVLDACRKDAGTGETSEGSGTGTTNGSCTVTASETDGPYPLYNSRGSAIQRVDITDGKSGVPLNMTITIQNTNNNCAILTNAVVDVWHCDKDGYYSGYSNSGYLGTQNNTSAVFCRGRQITDTNGQAKFITVYPGWYTGRITHIHAQIYVGGVLKLTTQIAFPQDITTAVYNSALYSAHGQNTSVTSNAQDGIFADGTGTEMATVVANGSGGYDLSIAIKVAA